MIIALIIFAILTIVCGILFIANGNNAEVAGSATTIFAFITVIALLMSLNFKLGSKELTGYIYSSSNRVGYTTAHIRFSQNAGTDAQPEFCVKTDSDAGRTIQKYVGSDTKVKVAIPAYFYFANNPFACGTTNMTIKEVKAS